MDYNFLFNPIKEYVFIIDENKQILEVNNIVLEDLGYSEEEILKKNFFDLYPFDRREELTSFFNKTTEGSIDSYSTTLISNRGKYIPVNLKLCKMKSGKNSIIFGSNHDNSEQKSNLSEKLYKNFFESSPFLIGLVNKKGILININDKANELLSIHPKQSLIGLSFEELFSANEQNKFCIPFFKDYFNKIFNGEKSTSFDFKFFKAVGEGIIWFRMNSTLLKLNDEDIIQFLAQDITDYKLSEHELYESQEKFSKAFHNNALSMSITSMDEGRIIDANEVFLKDLGYTREEVIGKTTKELNIWINWNNRASLQQLIREKGVVYNFEMKFRTKSGEIRYGLFSISRIFLNNIPHFIVIVNDITEIKIAEKKIKASEKKYRDAYNRIEFYKDIFAHDINNILHSNLSAVQIMKMLCNSKEEKDKFGDFLKIIISQVDRGTRLVDYIQKLSKLDEKEIILEKIEILSLLQKSINSTKNSFREKNFKIQIDFNEDKLYLQANSLIQDVFDNILLNSMRYNKNNTVEIVIKVSKIEENSIKYYKIEFIDNGMGIEDSRKNLIFYRTFQDKYNFRGFGLGLSLVNKIIKAFRGKIWIEDRVKGDYSKGSKFIIMLPEVIFND